MHERLVDRNPVVPSDQLLAQMVPPAMFDDVSFEYLPDCGHFPPAERPDLVAEQLRAFFS